MWPDTSRDLLPAVGLDAARAGFLRQPPCLPVTQLALFRFQTFVGRAQGPSEGPGWQQPSLDGESEWDSAGLLPCRRVGLRTTVCGRGTCPFLSVVAVGIHHVCLQLVGINESQNPLELEEAASLSCGQRHHLLYMIGGGLCTMP